MTLTQRILDHIAEHGPASRTLLAEALDADWSTVSRLLTRLCKERKQLYITRFERGSADELHRARAVYALGDKKSASRPKPDERAKKQRWYAKRKRLSTMNNVFNLGLTNDHWKTPCKLSHSSASPA